MDAHTTENKTQVFPHKIPPKIYSLTKTVWSHRVAYSSFKWNSTYSHREIATKCHFGSQYETIISSKVSRMSTKVKN